MNETEQLQMLLGQWLPFAQAVGGFIAVSAAAYVVARGFECSKALKKHRNAFFMFVGMWALYAGAKHALIQVVDCPHWLTYTVAYVEEQPTKAKFTFSSPSQIPPETVINFDVAIGGGTETNWIERPPAVYGLLEHEVSTADLSPSHITNYIVRITSDYVPEETYIHDFSAIASKTNLAVTCDFTCSTNLVGALGVIMHRDLVVSDDIVTGEWPWQTDYTFTAERENHITLTGNFVSRGTDREFIVVVSNEVLNVWRFAQ